MNFLTNAAASIQPEAALEEVLFVDHVTIQKAALILRAINHKLRYELILLIHNNPGITVTEIYVKLRIEQSVASQHLAILRRVGILLTKRDGKFIFYAVNYEQITKINEYSKELKNLTK